MKHILLAFVLVFASFCGCSGVSSDDDSSETPTPSTPTPLPVTDFSVDIVGSSWGYYQGVNGYGLDNFSCSPNHIGILSTGSSAPPSVTTCANVGTGSAFGFSLDLSGCDLDSRAQRIITNCSADGGAIVSSLSITASPTYPDGSGDPTDVYGTVDLHVTLSDGSSLTVSGPYSHCSGGQPCGGDSGLIVPELDIP